MRNTESQSFEKASSCQVINPLPTHSKVSPPPPPPPPSHTIPGKGKKLARIGNFTPPLIAPYFVVGGMTFGRDLQQENLEEGDLFKCQLKAPSDMRVC